MFSRLKVKIGLAQEAYQFGHLMNMVACLLDP